MSDATHVTPKTLIIFFGFLIFTALYGTLLCGLWISHFAMRGVLAHGYETEAILETKYVDQNTRYWFQYRFTTTTDDTYLSSIEVSESEYHDYATGVLLPMRYAPDNPNYNALDLLYDEVQRDLWGVLGLSLFVVLVAGALAFEWLRTLSLVRVRSYFDWSR